MTDQPRIRVKLKSFDHRVIDEAAKKIIQAALVSGAQVVGPVPLPTKKKAIVVTASPHTDKDSREQFAILTHKRLIDIVNPTNKTIDSLQHLDLPAGVGIEIKM
ncbi:30S ribosomal protein S10 [Candidatus Collierbacteria bacterium CG1_02_44_10]|uniref:Small ribosomal subunit protein uS10 n=4 Tax=Candidatus Collieribacteriota TaxID=1752725 RepID=A0A2H0DU00_9BACT|nr:30S ribosomal protein S10 [bacterium]OIN91202.1 MAG: 30S ribosomal protein S10 [Candidatus Collierbacteria bacterium CG1_02_44_10]PIP85643.1 MAG: 30S ribosomal protein S10 [Candidatus Collierbacteria bacterium CG22_combo_CG10-13_8_21_14_all_43_12]PIR99550.1 MAG: 30S ribosomal protein S10 [Candidatus Collierbacteria bacterium CG10_big_fil_rev_8_21_14_0_10_43_36]PIZ24329.1 MAG: 30S ribosomal protein S10 [Candidatus Collierbacteria bacterium CG_4_10_14_0_8_um_filter_43_86]PJB48072.1 MAG: 30S r